MSENVWRIYLSGEIHTDWRERIIEGSKDLPVEFYSPVTDHESSDLCGEQILGAEELTFWRDRKGASINSIRTNSLIETADILVVRFGPKYKQWNAAYDAGYASALGKPIITLHEEEHDHALKEVDAAARATASTPDQVVEILKYVILK
ncbi:MAG: YtoQ family protein, partial [Thermodesulfobacteriota bacterium]